MRDRIVVLHALIMPTTDYPAVANEDGSNRKSAFFETLLCQL